MPDVWRLSQSEIEERVTEITEQLEENRLGRAAMLAQLEMYQEICCHPDMESGNTWGRWPYRRCRVCGKKW